MSIRVKWEHARVPFQVNLAGWYAKIKHAAHYVHYATDIHWGLGVF